MEKEQIDFILKKIEPEKEWIDAQLKSLIEIEKSKSNISLQLYLDTDGKRQFAYFDDIPAPILRLFIALTKKKLNDKYRLIEDIELTLKTK